MAKPQPRWRRRKDDRPAEILAAALDCFAERGFAATRLDDIARRAGVTRGTLYLYFQSKEDLFKAVIGKRLVAALIRRGIARGEFRNVPTDHIVFQVMGPLILAALWRHSLGHFDPEGLDPDALCRAHADLLLNGLLKRREGVS